MGLLLEVASIYVPGFIRKRQLESLFQSTADAFGVEKPSVKGLSFEESLKSYARFTSEQADRAIQQGNDLEVQSRLSRNAYRIGEQLKVGFHISTAEQVMRMSAMIYKLLHIEFHGKPGGNIVIPHCFFSAYYSIDVCRLISSLDEGLLAGLSGGGKLSFSRRITGGNECCRAYFQSDRKMK
jgi:hypothetical protein